MRLDHLLKKEIKLVIHFLLKNNSFRFEETKRIVFKKKIVFLNLFMPKSYSLS